MKNKLLIILLISLIVLFFSGAKNDTGGLITVETFKITNMDELDPDNIKSLAKYKDKTAVFTSKDIIKYDKKTRLLTINGIDINKLYRKPLLISLNKEMTTGCFDSMLYSSVNPILYKCRIIFWDYRDMADNKTWDKKSTILKVDFRDNKALEEKWNMLIKK